MEGVQPSIPQNPTTNSADLLPKGPNANAHLAAANGLDNVNVKPLVKHVLSKESQELFNKLSGALTDETNIEWQNAALAAISTEPGIHQLTTYLLSFIAEKVTHNLKNLFVLEQMMKATQALLDNQAIYLDPYVAYMVPPVLTCCTANNLGPRARQASSNAFSETLNGSGINGHAPGTKDHYDLRNTAASMLNRICKKYSSSNQGLKARIARTCLKQFMDPKKSFGTHYGALQALILILGIVEAMKMLILPNIKMYNDLLKDALADDAKRGDAERMVSFLMSSFTALARTTPATTTNGVANIESLRERLTDRIGDVLTEQIVSQNKVAEAQAILERDLSM